MQIAKNICLLVGCFLGLTVMSVFAQEPETEEREYPNKEDNAECLVCHGNKSFRETSEEYGETILRNMFPCLIIDTVRFYESNHWSFACLDCHTYDYKDYPHPRDAKFEYMPTCMDCHDGDDAMEKYNLPKITEEYEKSHHTTLTDTKYSCWSCHDPHGFKMTVREAVDIKETIVSDNAMCLKCHSGTTATDLLLGTGLDPLIATHDWIPETENHFRNVRCIECHGKLADDVLVAHDILPAKDAVKSCAECHSKDSRLIHSLYKFQLQEGRMEKGFLRSLVSGDVYIVGANQNTGLNWISIIIFGCALLGVFGHALIRIIKK